jgi:adenosylmethionine-8-amino-7-oxononanoate aminotransferase
MAYQYWQQVKGQFPFDPKKKNKFVSLVNAYHGDTIGSVSIGGIDLFHKIFHSLLFDKFSVPAPYCYRCHLNLSFPSCGISCLGQAKSLFEERGSEIAGLVVEPLVQGAAGMLTFPQGYLSGLAVLAKRHHVLLIADEVATGFGRTGTMFACEQEGVTPDILCLAKGITGGYLPLAATITTTEIYNAFIGQYSEMKTFFHGHTYTGNPLACSAALASLAILEEEKTLTHLASKIKFLSKGLNRFWKLSGVGDIRQKGFMAGIELVACKETKKPFPWEEKIGIKVIIEARKRGLILRPLGNVIVLMPPLSIREDELKTILDITYQSIKEVTGP